MRSDQQLFTTSCNRGEQQFDGAAGGGPTLRRSAGRGRAGARTAAGASACGCSGTSLLKSTDLPRCLSHLAGAALGGGGAAAGGSARRGKGLLVRTAEGSRAEGGGVHGRESGGACRERRGPTCRRQNYCRESNMPWLHHAVVDGSRWFFLVVEICNSASSVTNSHAFHLYAALVVLC